MGGKSSKPDLVAPQPIPMQPVKGVILPQRISQADTSHIQHTQLLLEQACKGTNQTQLQEYIDQLFSKVEPQTYKNLVTSPQGVRYNLLHPLLRLYRANAGPNGELVSEDDLFTLIERNPMLVPSCHPQQSLFQTLWLYLRRPYSPAHNLKGIKLLLSRIESENVNIDVLYSIYIAFEEQIQHTYGITTPEQLEIARALLGFIHDNAAKVRFPETTIKPPSDNFNITMHHICLVGARTHHRVQVPPTFYMMKSRVDNKVFRQALADIVDLYQYDFYHPYTLNSSQKMSDQLPYPHNCLFHAPVVGGDSEQKKIQDRQILNLDDEYVVPTLPQSCCGSAFTFLSQNQLFSLDLVIYLLHLAARDQVRVIKQSLGGGYPNGISNDEELYKSIASATRDWLCKLSSSYGIPCLATYLSNALALVDKINFVVVVESPTKAVNSFEPLTASALKFIISMCNSYKGQTLFADAQGKQKPPQPVDFRMIPREQQDIIYYDTISKEYAYNPFPLMFALRFVAWLSAFTPTYIDYDVFQYLQLFIGQLLPSSFSTQLAPLLSKQENKHTSSSSSDLATTPEDSGITNTADGAQKDDENNDEIFNLAHTVRTMGDKHKLSLGKFASLWPSTDDALLAYTHFDNSLPFYTETTLKVQELWSLVEHYNYNDISSVQTLFNPFFQTLLFPNFSIYNKRSLTLTTMLASLGMLSNAYGVPRSVHRAREGSRKAYLKHPTLMMETSALGGTATPKSEIFCYIPQDDSPLTSVPRSGWKIIPAEVFANPMGLPLQFGGVYMGLTPTFQKLPSFASMMVDKTAAIFTSETAQLNSQLAFTRHVLTKMTHNSLNSNISLHVFLLQIFQALMFQVHSCVQNDSQACVIKTQISASLYQLKNYTHGSGSLFAQLSAEYKPSQQFSNASISRNIPPPSNRTVDRFLPPLNTDFFASSQRRKQYLSNQLPILQQTINMLCSSGLIWSLLLPNLQEVFTASGVAMGSDLSGICYAQLSNVYSLTMLIFFQILSLQAYIIEQQESIISSSVPSYSTATPENIQTTPALPFSLGLKEENVTNWEKSARSHFTTAQTLNFTLTTYLCYLAPLSPNVFAATVVGALFRIADGFILKLQQAVAASRSQKITLLIQPLEYFCSLLCYQALVYNPDTATLYFNSGGVVVAVDGEEDAEKAKKKAEELTGAKANSSHLFGTLIETIFDLSAYDTSTLPELPEISHAFLWLLQGAKVVEKFQYKRSFLGYSLEAFVQEHYQNYTVTQPNLSKLEANANVCSVPPTPEVMYYIDCTITTYTHLNQWNNHYRGLEFQKGDKFDDDKKDKEKEKEKNQNDFEDENDKNDKENDKKKNQSRSVIEILPHETFATLPSRGVRIACTTAKPQYPYQSMGLLAFMLDSIYQPSIDDVMSLLQGILPNEKTLSLLREETDDSIDISSFENFYIVPSYLDQLQRVVSTPVRPYTYGKWCPRQGNTSGNALNSQNPGNFELLFSKGLKELYINETMGYLTSELLPHRGNAAMMSKVAEVMDSIDNIHAGEVNFEYQQTLGVEIFIIALLRRCPEAILTAIANVVQYDVINQATRPMYIIDCVTKEQLSFSVFDFLLAANTETISSGIVKMMYEFQ